MLPTFPFYSPFPSPFFLLWCQIQSNRLLSMTRQTWTVLLDLRKLFLLLLVWTSLFMCQEAAALQKQHWCAPEIRQRGSWQSITLLGKSCRYKWSNSWLKTIQLSVWCNKKAHHPNGEAWWSIMILVCFTMSGQQELWWCGTTMMTMIKPLDVTC